MCCALALFQIKFARHKYKIKIERKGNLTRTENAFLTALKDKDLMHFVHSEIHENHIRPNLGLDVWHQEEGVGRVEHAVFGDLQSQDQKDQPPTSYPYLV